MIDSPKANSAKESSPGFQESVSHVENYRVRSHKSDEPRDSLLGDLDTWPVIGHLEKHCNASQIRSANIHKSEKITHEMSILSASSSQMFVMFFLKKYSYVCMHWFCESNLISESKKFCLCKPECCNPIHIFVYMWIKCISLYYSVSTDQFIIHEMWINMHIS